MNASYQNISRRDALRFAGLTGLAVSGLNTSSQLLAMPREATSLPLVPAKAKRVIFLFMHGGPSQVDTFDFKPQLQKDHGKELPFKAASNIDAVPKLMKSPWRFSRHGESGGWVSELLPNMAKHIDDMCVVRSMHSRGQSHGQAVSMIHTGSDSLVRPSVGAWVSYGLGTENANLPAFVSISPASGHGGSQKLRLCLSARLTPGDRDWEFRQTWCRKNLTPWQSANVDG